MLKKILTTSFVILLINLAILPTVFAAETLSKEAKLAAKVKAGIAKLGTGKDTRIKVKLKDGTKLKGYISEITEDTFTVTDPDTGTSTAVPYPGAKQVRGNNLSSRMKVAIGFAIFFAVISIIYAAGPDD